MGRDVIIAAMMGAEEFGIGTTSLSCDGLHNGAPVPLKYLSSWSLHSRSKSLRKKFTGTPEKVVNLFSFIARRS